MNSQYAFHLYFVQQEGFHFFVALVWFCFKRWLDGELQKAHILSLSPWQLDLPYELRIFS